MPTTRQRRFVRASDVRRAVGTLNDLTVDPDTGEIRGVGAAPAQAAPAAPAIPAAARLSPGVTAVLRDADVTEAWAERVTVGLPARADFSFMSWNILANRFAPGPGRATHMAWRDRFNAIVARIVSVSPAILCVHELTNKPGESTYDELQAALAPCGYAGAVLTEGMATASAIFYDRKQFRHVVTFKNAADLARTGGTTRAPCRARVLRHTLERRWLTGGLGVHEQAAIGGAWCACSRRRGRCASSGRALPCWSTLPLGSKSPSSVCTLTCVRVRAIESRCGRGSRAGVR